MLTHSPLFPALTAAALFMRKKPTSARPTPASILATPVRGSAPLHS